MRHDRTERPVVPFLHTTSDVSNSKFFQFVAVRSCTADRSLLQPTGSVNTTPHTSTFHSKLHAHAWLKFGSALTPSHPCFMRIVVVVSDCSLFDDSTFLSFLTIFSLITLSFLVNFIFQDVVDKFPVHFR